MSPQERENQLAINAHVSRLKRAMAEAITPEDMKQLAAVLYRKAVRGDIKAGRLLERLIKSQRPKV
jgi:transcription initiation factor TFIIIB Brf1 subunit/transcription initiation factor TFIIB